MMMLSVKTGGCMWVVVLMARYGGIRVRRGARWINPRDGWKRAVRIISRMARLHGLCLEQGTNVGAGREGAWWRKGRRIVYHMGQTNGEINFFVFF